MNIPALCIFQSLRLPFGGGRIAKGVHEERGVRWCPEVGETGGKNLRTVTVEAAGKVRTGGHTVH